MAARFTSRTAVERAQDRLDTAYIHGGSSFTQAEYEARCEELEAWDSALELLERYDHAGAVEVAQSIRDDFRADGSTRLALLWARVVKVLEDWDNG